MNKIITIPLFLWLFSTVVLAQDSIPVLPKPVLEMVVKSKDTTKQHDPWELGLVLGGGYYLGDLLSLGSVKLNTFKPGGAFFLRNNVSNRFSLRFQAMYTGISGNGLNLKNSYEPVTSFSFKSTIFESSILLEWDFLGAKRFPSKGGFNKIFSPYIFVGAGVASSWTSPKYPNNIPSKAANITKDSIQARRTNSMVTVPFGIGAKLDVSRRLMLAFEWGARPTFSDYIDGISLSANKDNKDWYNFGNVQLIYRFPYKPKPVKSPSKDNDKNPAFADKDGDGIPDTADRCPDVAGMLRGCPDADDDGVSDLEDKCPNEAGLVIFGGCPDTDGDGIPNADDECPDQAGVASNQGCPSGTEIDRDGDGVPNTQDECPDIPGKATFKGCPDTDGDGVMDKEDRCPVTPGSAENRGCPVIRSETKETLKFVTQNVLFYTNSAKLTDESYVVLNKVLDVLQDYPDYAMLISGFTDNVGSQASNQALSENRAAACLNYLVGKGIDPSRLVFRGFGEVAPITTNESEQGRKLNRRVEFALFLK
jgi:outer membrane protein OmpA-like peptidoglycan-associated protein